MTVWSEPCRASYGPPVRAIRFKAPRRTAEENCNGLCYDVFSAFMMHGKDRLAIADAHGERAAKEAGQLLRDLIKGGNVRLGRIGSGSYWFGVQITPRLAPAEDRRGG